MELFFGKEIAEAILTYLQRMTAYNEEKAALSGFLKFVTREGNTIGFDFMHISW